MLLGGRDGRIVDGGGTDRALTIDHKPNTPSEQQRIERCGEFVDCSKGIPRVNGELAVARALGDTAFKATGGPGPEDRPVTAAPDMAHFQCRRSDFVVVVCDGISEGEAFPNSAVVQAVAQSLHQNGDPAAAAQAVCKEALRCRSKDNLSCMVVLLAGAAVLGVPETRTQHFTPGPLNRCDDDFSEFYSAFESMSERANLSGPEAVQRRFEMLQTKREAGTLEEGGAEEAELGMFDCDELGDPVDVKSEDRAEWFEEWVDLFGY